MSDLPADPASIPLRGSILIVGPVASGKTRLTGVILERWLARRGPDGVVVLDFGPDIEIDDHVLGGRLTRFVDLPSDVFYGTIDARAPRFEADTTDQARTLAAKNARGARRLLKQAPPSPRAVTLNDATIAFHGDLDVLDRLFEYVESAELVVVNAYRGTSFDPDHPISALERRGTDRLISWADRVIDLNEDGQSGRPDGP